MQVFKENKVVKVILENGETYELHDDFGDGTIVNIVVGEELKEEIEGWDFEDWDDNEVPTSEVKLKLDVMDGEDGWSVFMKGDGTEVIEA